MKRHTKIYLDYFNFKIPEDCICELCENMAVDIHHIDSRGMGGDPTGKKDIITNLQALCRSCHIKFGDDPKYKIMLALRHFDFMVKYEANKKN